MKQRLDPEFAIFLCFAFLLFSYMIMAITGCSSIPGDMDPVGEEVITKYDLFGSINGVRFEGVGVMTAAPKYKIRIESKQDVDLFTVTTCHREFVTPDVIEGSGWFKKNRGYEYVMTPSPGIEDTGSCLIRIGSYNKSVQNQNAHAIIDIRTPRETLPVNNICNGVSAIAGGVSICQSKVGLIQRLQFETKVNSLQQGQIPSIEKVCTGKWLTDLVWEYNIPEGECVIAFMESNKPNRVHRHTVIGYTKVRIK